MLRTKPVSVLAALFAALLLLTGCSGDAEMEALIREARESAAAATSTFVRPQMEVHDPETPVPGLAYTPDFTPDAQDGPDGELARLLYARLYQLDEHGAPVPDLVRIHSVTDTGEHRFSLDLDAQFADGKALTEEDVLFSLRRGGLAASFDGATLVIPPGQDVELRLALLPLLREGTTDAFFPLSSRGYVVVDGQVCDRDGVPLYNLVQVTAPEELLAAYQTGEIQSLTVFGSEPDAVFPHGRAWKTDVGGRVLYSLVFRTDQPVFAESYIRRAVAAAVDRTEFASEWLEPAFLFVPDWSYLWTPEQEQEALDRLDAARQPLEASVTLLCRDDGATMRRMAETIGWQLRRAGMTVTVSVLAEAAYRRALDAGAYDLLLQRTQLPPDLSLAAVTGDGPVFTQEASADLERRLTDLCAVTPLAFSKGQTWTHIG